MSCTVSPLPGGHAKRTRALKTRKIKRTRPSEIRSTRGHEGPSKRQARGHRGHEGALGDPRGPWGPSRDPRGPMGVLGDPGGTLGVTPLLDPEEVQVPHVVFVKNNFRTQFSNTVFEHNFRTQFPNIILRSGHRIVEYTWFGEVLLGGAF